MDPHPLLMLSLPCLFRLPHEQHAERGEETCTKSASSQNPVCIIICSQRGEGVGGAVEGGWLKEGGSAFT